MFEDDKNIIHSYTREQALEDGFLIDVSRQASEAGVVVPTAVTDAVWTECIAITPEIEGTGQSVEGRIWDVVWMFSRRAKGARENTVKFKIHVRYGPKERDVREVDLKAVIGPGDNMEPVITIMLPHED